MPLIKADQSGTVSSPQSTTVRSASEVRGKPDADLWILGAIAAVISLAAFFYYFHNGSLLLYGDAVAHMNIARRTIDSRTPGPLQLGTVWLPLPHILMLPLVAFTWMWRTGVGGAIPSMIAYVASVLGVFRLVRSGLQRGFGLERESRMAAWFATLTFAANPNLIYLQTTAMTEPLYLAFFIWATVYFSDFVFGVRDGKDEAAQKALVRSGFCLFLGNVDTLRRLVRGRDVWIGCDAGDCVRNASSWGAMDEPAARCEVETRVCRFCALAHHHPGDMVSVELAGI